MNPNRRQLTDPNALRQQLRRSGFYEAWKKKMGDEAWGLPEATTGKLA